LRDKTAKKIKKNKKKYQLFLSKEWWPNWIQKLNEKKIEGWKWKKKPLKSTKSKTNGNKKKLRPKSLQI
jgi:hypothetical protein